MTVSLQVGDRVKYHTIGGITSTMNTSTNTGEIVDNQAWNANDSGYSSIFPSAAFPTSTRTDFWGETWLGYQQR